MTERNGGGRNIGRGMEFIARRYSYERSGAEGKVLKKTYYPLFDSTDNPLGRSMKKRAETDLELIKGYFGERLVTGAEVMERFGKWYISQPYYEGVKLQSRSPQVSLVKPELERIFEQNDKLVRDTGFTLDMIGVEFFGNLGNYLKDPTYWSLDSFRIKEDGENPELRLVDTGLLWTRIDPPREPQHINIHELPAGWTAVNIILPIVRERLSEK